MKEVEDVEKGRVKWVRRRRKTERGEKKRWGERRVKWARMRRKKGR